MKMSKNAKWIRSPKDTGVAAVTFRREWAPEKTVKSASWAVTSLGNYVPTWNGIRVTDAVLMPGWTSYKKRIQVQTYDVTAFVKKRNTLGVTVGQGWAIGYIGYRDGLHYFGDRVAAVATLEVTYTDGTKEEIVTDAKWDAYTAEVLSTEIYHGETVDKTAKIEKIGKAEETTYSAKLVPQVGEWIKEQERLSPVELIVTPKGEVVLDFGQNMTGYVEVRVKGKRGDRIVLHHAEVLDKDGNFYTDNYRTARNENIYVLSGENDVFKPSFSFQGFRYVQLVEYPFDKVELSSFTGVAVHSDMKRTGHFVCGNEKVNQLYHNIVWGQKCNYLDVPTDCPQRDERLGWTGDAEIFCRTAAINYDVETFFRKWLGDVAIEQLPNGAVQGVVPDCLPVGTTRISAAWGDVATVAPWEMYLAYGDKAFLRKNFPMMKKWVNYIRSAGPEEYLWLGGFHYGDWLGMDAGPDSYVGATANDLIASAYFALSTQLVVKAGRVLGEDVTEYEALYQKVRKAFRAYFMENGMPKAEFPLTEVCPRAGHAPVDTVRRGVTQTAIVLILHFGLCEESERAALTAQLVKLIRENGNLMSTGFVGTPYLLHALSENGETALAYELLLQEKNPSWLYSVCHGATTMWEHWNSLKEDGSFWSTHMNSFNHYAYGAVFDWIFGVSVGVTPEEGGYRVISLAPHPSKTLGFAEGSIESRNGKIRSYWYYKGDTVYYEFEIPEGVEAHLFLPSGKKETLFGGVYHFAEKD